MRIYLNKSFFIIPLLLIGMAMIFSFGINIASATPSQIYVSNTGNDDWSGQSSTWNGTDGPKHSIKNATAVVQNDGTVHIANGTYNENDITVSSKNVNYIGDSKLKTIINGNKISRLFTVGAQGVTYSFFFSNLSFINGKSNAGGAIWNYGSTTFDNCIFMNNNATFSGGAIYSSGIGSAPAALTLNNCIFNNNTCNNGILLNALSTLSVTGTDFINNTGTTQSILWNNFGTIANFQFNRLIGSGKMISSDSGGDLSLNWWGSNIDPSTHVTGVSVTPWLVLTSTANPTSIINGAKSTVTADLLHDSGILSDPTHPNLYYHDPLFGHVPDGITVNFASDNKGTLNPNINGMVNGQAKTTFTAGIVGTSSITSTVDSQSVSTNVNISNVKLAVSSSDPINNAINVPVNKVIKITFNIPIKAGTAFNNITVKNAAGWAASITKTISGNVLTIALAHGTYLPGNKFIINLPVNSIADLSGNGLTQAFTSSFVVATIPLAVTATDPVNNAINVPTNKIIKITFNEPVQILGTNPWIELKSSTGKPIAIKWSVNGNVLSITPAYLLGKATKYVLTLHANCIADLSGKGLTPSYTTTFTTTK